MAGKQTLTQEQKLAQRLSPLQLQLVPLLQMNSLEIEEHVMNEINDNPALEVNENASENQLDDNINKDEYGDEFKETADDILNADYRNEDDIPYYRLNASNRSADDEAPNAILISQTSPRMPPCTKTAKPSIRQMPSPWLPNAVISAVYI